MACYFKFASVVCDIPVFYGCYGSTLGRERKATPLCEAGIRRSKKQLCIIKQTEDAWQATEVEVQKPEFDQEAVVCWRLYFC